MRRFSLFVLAMGMALVVVAPTAASAAGADNNTLNSSLGSFINERPVSAPLVNDPPSGGHEFVVGSQRVTLGDQSQFIQVSAHSLPGGVDPKGQVHLSVNCCFTTADVMGDVDCLNVGPSVGPPGETEADVDAILRQPYMGYTHVTLIIIDRGPPQMGESMDQAFWAFTNFNPPSNCSNYGTELLGRMTGNFVAHDVVE